MKTVIFFSLILLYSLQLYATPPATIYYTKASGEWNDVNTWGTSCGGGAGSIPGATDNAVICNGYTVTTSSAITCNTLTLSFGGTLNCNAGSAINVTTATTIVGTFNLNAGTFNTSQNFIVVGSFNLIGGTFDITDDFEVIGAYNMSGGTFNTTKELKVNALGTLNMTAGAINLTGGVNCDLLIDGTVNLSGGTIDVTHYSYVEFGGIFNVSGTGSFTARDQFNMVYGAGGTVNMTGGTMVFMGDFYSNIPDNDFNQTAGIIQFTGVGSRWTMKAAYNASGTAEAIFDGSTELYLLASGDWNFYDLTINSGKTMNQNNADTISVAGDWKNNTGTYTHNSNRVVFDGVADQSIGGTSGTTFYDMTIRNTGASGTDDVILDQPTIVSHSLLLINGIINSTAVNLLTLTSNLTTATNGGNAGSFVSGPMSWNLTTGGTYVFPTGKAPTKWARAALSDLTGSTYFTAEYFKAGHGTIASTDLIAPLRYVSAKEYWGLSEADATIDAAVTLYWEDASYSGITNCTPGGDLVVGHFNGTMWEDMGNSGGITGTCVGASAGTVKSGIQTSFSPFTFASGGLSPLPIELLSFNAKPNVSMVDLSWSTASELNNDYFTIEKTKDGVNFEIVGVIKGAGNSTSKLNYEYVDNRPYSRVSYYRLKQTDFDGNFSYSELIMVSFEKPSLFSLNVYPNPNNGRAINLQINGISNEEVLVVVYDILGNEIFSKVIITNENDSDVHAIDPSQKLPVGVYIISATSDQKIYNKRLIVN